MTTRTAHENLTLRLRRAVIVSLTESLTRWFVKDAGTTCATSFALCHFSLVMYSRSTIRIFAGFFDGTVTSLGFLFIFVASLFFHTSIVSTTSCTETGFRFSIIASCL